MSNTSTREDSALPRIRSDEDVPVCRFTVWKAVEDDDSQTLGKNYTIRKGQLHERAGDLGVRPKHAEVVETYDIDGLAWIIENWLHHGRGFITSGIPIDESIDEAPAVLKKHRRPGCLSRSKKDICWKEQVGAYFPIDYDSKWDPDGPRSAEEIREALAEAHEMAGADVSHLAMLTYPSSSSGFVKKSNGRRLDNGGKHLIYLVSDGADIGRYRDALEGFLTLSGHAYGAVSDSGRFLRRSILDRAAVSPTQPTFAGIPAYDKARLANVREKQSVRYLGGDGEFLDTRTVRDLSLDERAQVDMFWRKEKDLLRPEIDAKTRNWMSQQGEELRSTNPKLSEERARQILEHRRSGNLVASDVIRMGNKFVHVSEILASPDEYDGVTGPDPVEPNYRGGAQVCKVYINRNNGRPMIHSKAHGETNYRLWYDPEVAIDRLKSTSPADAIAVSQTVLPYTRFSDATELESFLKAVAKTLGTTKSALLKTYGKTLRKNIHAAAHGGAVSEEPLAVVRDIAHLVAKEFVDRETSIITDDYSVWRYCVTHYEPITSLHLESIFQRELTKHGWENEAGLTRTVKDAVCALKQITFSSDSPVNQSPRPIFNCLNGELHILPNGDVDFRDHSPDSGLTSVLPISYDPNAKAPIFAQTLEELFLPAAQDRILSTGDNDAEDDRKPYLQEARAMRRHLEEVMAYLAVPKRWLTVWFIFIGAGSNGKTLVTRILDSLLPPGVVESDRLKAFTKDNFGMERIINKTIIVDDDLDTGTTIPDGFVKKISEEKSLSANRKNKTSVTFTNRAALLLLSNNYPRFVDVSDGMLRRLQSIPFRRRFYKSSEIDAMPDKASRSLAAKDLANLALINKIREELPGVLATLVRAYRRLVRRGDFALPDAVQRSNEKIIYESNPLPLFIKTQCDHHPDYRVRTSDFCSQLRNWLDDENFRWKAPNRQVRKMMRNLHYVVGPINGHEHYYGVRPKDLPATTSDNVERHSRDDLDDWDSEYEYGDFELEDDGEDELLH